MATIRDMVRKQIETSANVVETAFSIQRTTVAGPKDTLNILINKPAE